MIDLKKRKFDEMVSYFNRKMSEMNIDQKYKMELLGMITAIAMEHDAELPKWIPVGERLPEEEKEVLVTVHFDGFKDKFDNLKPGNYVEIASQIDGEWSSYSDEFKVAKSRHHVIAWMPTPEPYGGKK